MNQAPASPPTAPNWLKRPVVPDLGQPTPVLPPNTQLSFHSLPDLIEFYLVDVYQSSQKLFITGVLPSQQSFTIYAPKVSRELYFVVRVGADPEAAKAEVEQRLRSLKILDFYCEVEFKKYVFELQDVPRDKHPYIRVRFLFADNPAEELTPNEEGRYYKYIFGTTYTPLELFVINTKIKGPCWVQVEKQHLRPDSVHTDGALGAEIVDPQLIEVIEEVRSGPPLRVLSIAVKAIVPSQLKRKKYFNVQHIDELHIYAISYNFCQSYGIDAKPAKYALHSRTLYLKDLGSIALKDGLPCGSESQMIGQLQADIKAWDPDVVVCHDASRIIDVLALRLTKIGDRHERPRLGRIVLPGQSRLSQKQRIFGVLAGRLLVDTFAHAQDFLRAVDYELGTLSEQLKHPFRGMSEGEVKELLDAGNPKSAVEQCQKEAEYVFTLMHSMETLQMTKKLSNICGVIWRRSLERQRAERNEYLIMHECAQLGIIIPDKYRLVKGGDEEEEEYQAKYQGGHVIEPKKGLYSDFVLLLDFNSLYPSVIREYNVCFSVVRRPLVPLTAYYKGKKRTDEHRNGQTSASNEGGDQGHLQEAVVPSFDERTRDKWGFLPQLIHKVVERRKRSKKQMENADPEKYLMLDVEQKCYKLVANSIYGCLGFPMSRFYSMHLAALITRQGRQALLRARDIAQGTAGVEVIYGDTDSLMLRLDFQATEDREKLTELAATASTLRQAINKEYSQLEIDIDGIFKPLLLLMKKKYVANKLENFQKVLMHPNTAPQYHLEFKGVEVVRRDTFELARNVLRHVVQLLMDSADAEISEIYAKIENYLRDIANEMPRLPYRQFLFTKILNKSPKDYAKGETIPHVKVALDRLAAGEREETLVDHAIKYVVCETSDSALDSLAKNCFDERTFERSQRTDGDAVVSERRLQVNFEYYKRELLQPLVRILHLLPLFDADRLARALGLSDDSRLKFKKQMSIEDEAEVENLGSFLSLQQVESGQEIQAKLGKMSCACGKESSFVEKGCFLLKCPHCGISSSVQLCTRIHLTIKTLVDSYYKNQFHCQCDKKYIVTPIAKCCPASRPTRSQLASEIHEFVYKCKELAQTSLRVVDFEADQTRLRQLIMSMDRILAMSLFERVVGMKSALNV